MSMPPDFDWLEDKPRRGRGCGCLFAAVLVVAAGGAGLSWLVTASPWAPALQARWADSPAGRQAAELQAQWARSPIAEGWRRVSSLLASGDRLAHLAPADAIVYAEFSPSWWNRLWLKGLPPRVDEESREGQDEARQALRDAWGLDWEQDMAPWIRPEGGLVGLPNGSSLWLASGDDGRARACLAKLRAHVESRGAIASDEHHGATDYVVIRPPAETPYAVGLLGGYVVAAIPPETMVRLIDQEEHGGPSLADDNARYRRIQSAWRASALGHAFVDLTVVGRGRADALRGAEAVGASLDAGSDWLTIDFTTAFPQSKAGQEFLPSFAMERFNRLPSATVLAFGGTATPETTSLLASPMALAWGPLGGAAGPGMVFSALLGSLKGLDGPFALGLVASDPEARDPVGAVLSIAPRDPEAAGRELEHTISSLSGAGTAAALPDPLAKIAAWPWVRGVLPRAIAIDEERHRGEPWKVVRAGGQSLAGWTVSKRDLVIAGGGEAVELCMGDRFEPLDHRESFRAVRGHLPGEVGAFVYADGANTVRLLEASPLLPAKYATSARRALAPLRALGVRVAPGIDTQGFHRAAVTFIARP